MSLFNTLFEITVYSAAIFVIIILFRLCLGKRMSPAMHYALWFLLIARLLVPVTIDSGLHFITVPAAAEQTQIAHESVIPQTLAHDIEFDDASVSSHINTEPKTPSPQINDDPLQIKPKMKISLKSVLIVIWLCGTAAILMQTLVCAWRMRRVLKKAEPALPEWQTMAEQIAADIKLTRRYRFVMMDSFPTPALYAALRPIVIVPEDMRTMNPEQVEFALCHELTHLRRRDHLVCLLTLLLRAVYWFNPVVWAMVSLMQRDMETACDSMATRRMSAETKSRYAGTMLTMYSRPRMRFVLGMALGHTRKTAERRIRGLFMKSKSTQSVRFAAVLMTAMLLITCFTTACKPISAAAMGSTLKVLAAAPAVEKPQPYQAPQRLVLRVDGLPKDCSVVCNAKVDMAAQDEWPVYAVKKATVTQKQADAARYALMGDAVLYKPSPYRSREEIQRDIEVYKNEMDTAVQQGYDDEALDYQAVLDQLDAEYDAAPETVVLEPANTQFSFMEECLLPELYNGVRVETPEGDYRYEWTDEARETAKAAGCENIDGICFLESGSKMEFHASNGDTWCGINVFSANGSMDDEEAGYSLETAIQKANDLIRRMGLDFVLTDTYTEPHYVLRSGEYVEQGQRWYTLVYKRSIEGVPQDNIVSCVEYDTHDNSAFWEQEMIYICMGKGGLLSMTWSDPMHVMKRQANVALMPFDELKACIAEHLRSQPIWDVPDEDVAHIDERRLEISKLKLSYLTASNPDNAEECDLIPVWNVCGDMYYHYRDDDANDLGWILDENGDRNVWNAGQNDYAILTINAIDGSIVPRHQWT